jgi:predicted amidohydrolase YtcJ
MVKKNVMDLLSADLVIINGKIVTVDKEFSIAQAVAIKDGKVIAVGKDEDIKELAGKNTKVLDLKGKTVLPGINDTHIHAVAYWGTRPPLAVEIGYPAVKSISDIVKAVADKVKTVKPGEWIQGWGWDEGYLQECLKDPARHLTKWDLDPVSPNNPVCLNDFSGHVILVNSKALEIAGVTKATPLPSGGEITKDPATGELVGLLKELPAEGLVMRMIPPLTRKQKREAVLTAVKELNSIGITSITEGALGPGGGEFQGGLLGSECIGVYNDLYNEGKLSLRVGIMLLFGEYGALSLKDLQKGISYLGIHSGFGSEWLRIAGVKMFADGIPPSKTAWMHEEYIGGGSGSLVLPGETEQERYNELINMIVYAHKHGFQVGIHATGGRAIDACVDGYIKALEEYPWDARHYVIHGDFTTLECAKRMAKYNIGVAVQSGIKWTISDFMDSLVGEQMSAWQWPLRTLIDTGVHLSGGSDSPVSYPNWKQGIEASVLRESKATGKVSGPEQCITREEAIRSYTIEGAWQDHMENIKGSIEAGKLADLCVLDEDILTVEPHKIKDIRTLMTIVGGKIVYDAR